jgi:hypothetical protein
MAVETWGGPPTKTNKNNKTHNNLCFYSKKTTKLLGRDEKKQKNKAHRVFVEKDSARSGPEFRSLTKYLNYSSFVFFCVGPTNLLFFLLYKHRFLCFVVFVFVFFGVAEPHSQCPMAVETWGGPPKKNENKQETT